MIILVHISKSKQAVKGGSILRKVKNMFYGNPSVEKY